MNLYRYCFNIVCRHQRASLILVIFVIVLLTIFQSQNNHRTPRAYLFEDGIAYCNAPNRQYKMNNHSVNNFVLLQVQVLIRHGDRAPIDLKALPNTGSVHISCLFNDTPSAYEAELAKVKNVAEKNLFQIKGSKNNVIIDERVTCNGGQLTPYGYLQHLYLGGLFKLTYKELLAGMNLEDDLLFLSTDVPRTIQSGVSFLTGAFYEDFLVRSTKMVVNVHRDRVVHGHFLLDESERDLECPVLKKKTRNIHETDSVKDFLSNVENLVKKMANMLLVPRDHMPSFNRLVDILFARLCHGQGVPLGPAYRLPNSLVKQALQYSHLYVNVYHSSLAELQSLSLLSQISLRFLDLLRDLPNRKKLILYSGHDTTVAPFLKLLDVWDGKWPPYASNVFVEFYQEEDNGDNSLKGRIISTYFRVVYNGQPLKNIKFCKSPKRNGELCPVKDLLKYVSNNIFDLSLANNMDQSTLNKLLFSRIRKLCLDSD